MRLDEKLKRDTREEIWQEYCGFADMSLSEYMRTQHWLLEEQLATWCNSGLGSRLLQGAQPRSIEELREVMPMTKYADYADILLPKRSEMLCEEPAIWLQTTWEGGLRPIKLAPYTRGMLDTYRHNLMAAMFMATAKRRGEFGFDGKERILYGGAPLPYITGLIPSLFDEDVRCTWLPDANTDPSAGFSQRIKKGFAMALSGGVDMFFGIGSVAHYITKSFSKIMEGNAPCPACGKDRARKDGEPVVPGDVFSLKALFYAGTDAKCYKDRLAKAWGITPVELASGTESTFLGAETWEHDGLIFFPDACFYEFIPEDEMRRNIADPGYVPRTCLMDEIEAGVCYELVLSVFHGGAFMRYRIGDMYRCLSAGEGKIPRLTFLDRVPTVIDIAGFTRITVPSMQEVIRLSDLKLGDWLIQKEFRPTGDPYLHMYLEIPADTPPEKFPDRSLLTGRLGLCFRHFDIDYDNLKKLLDMEPLELTILKHGTISAYEAAAHTRVPRINPGRADIDGILRMAGSAETEPPSASDSSR